MTKARGKVCEGASSQCPTPTESSSQLQFSPASGSSATLSIDIDEQAFSIDGEAMGVAGVSPPSTRNNSAQSSPRLASAAGGGRGKAQRRPQQAKGAQGPGRGGRAKQGRSGRGQWAGADEAAGWGGDDAALGFSRAVWMAEVGRRAELPTGLEKTLTAQVLHTYETRLFPSAASIEVKRAFIEKFAGILAAEFPGWAVDIHVFGSSVNGLGTARSDIDICLTTAHRELEDVFVLGQVLRAHGMRTYCVARARVPIVKVWDAGLRMAADINVNNTIALHNTRMLQTFVAADGRVRPFVMAVKHWTKCRDINDAAFGGTLSSYAWATLAIHFLQTRDPPIAPVLHPARRADAGAVDLAFDDDIERLREFGRANTESLGFLLYAFFRTYAFEFDYRHQVVSLRGGCYLTKAQKGWDCGRPARIFCIEEPFSTWLNLAHSANSTAVEGIRQEFQRAFRILRDGGSYEQVCEVYQRPQSEVYQRPQSEVYQPQVLQPQSEVYPRPQALSRHRRRNSNSSSSSNHSAGIAPPPPYGSFYAGGTAHNAPQSAGRSTGRKWAAPPIVVRDR
ncbi:hypothetical protein LPJ63_000725 [Coemansia sp. RSA 2711]|nr:hypothetical protein LPJ63_000725 [Coemansia sp. RSA 2711]